MRLILIVIGLIFTALGIAVPYYLTANDPRSSFVLLEVQIAFTIGLLIKNL